MADLDKVFESELESLAPDGGERGLDWDDVLRRARPSGTHRRPARATRRTRRGALALVAAASALALSGVAVAGFVLVKSPEEEAQGLLDGHSVFAGTNPVCVQLEEGFRCVLDSPPTGPGTTVEGSYRNAKVQTVDADSRIDGGCIGVSDDGRVWRCYLGEAAVEHDIIDPGSLGQFQAGPAHG